jgi:hypothetical protein
MVRKECKNKRNSVPGMKELGDWLEAHMNQNWHKVHHRDAMIPSVIYSVKVPMLDQDWLNYNQALAHFKDARELHNLLARGREELDQITEIHVDAASRLTGPQLTVPNRSLEEMLVGLVKQNSLGLPWDWGRPIGAVHWRGTFFRREARCSAIMFPFLSCVAMPWRPLWLGPYSYSASRSHIALE